MSQSRNLGPIALAVGVISLLIALAGQPFLQAHPRSIIASVVTGVGWVVGALAIACATLFLRRNMDRRRLLSGKGVIARWHVSPADWALFLQVDEAWAPGGGKRIRPGQAGPEGVSIFAGRDGIVIGEAFHRFNIPNDVAWLPTQPECIELCIPDGEGLYLETLRMPVPASSRTEGQRAFNAWDSRIKQRSREQFRRICKYDSQRGPI